MELTLHLVMQEKSSLAIDCERTLIIISNNFYLKLLVTFSDFPAFIKNLKAPQNFKKLPNQDTVNQNIIK